MASKKRSATRELNHENWDNDEEKEERGVFEQARGDVLQGRIIKKAKRRGGNAESGTGGTFAAFGGFKSGADAAGNPPKQGFEFLKSLSSNGGSNGKPAATSTEKKEEETTPSDKSSSSIPLSQLFKAKAGSWKCSVCEISNEGSLDKCAACTTAKPGGTSSSSGKKWTCDSCLVPNEAQATSCVCCQTKKPGTASSNNNNGSSFSFGKTDSPSSAFKFGSNGGFQADTKGFSFGKDSKTSSESTTGFKFGSDSASSKTSTESPSGFKFGAAESSKTPDNTSGFKFGSSSDKTPSAPSQGFSFGSVSTTTSTTASSPSGFKFASTASPSAVTTPTSSTKDSFSFKGGSPSSSAFKFEPSSTPSTPSFSSKLDKKDDSSLSRDKYASNLRALNRQLAKWVKSKVDENPNVILSPIFADYEKHLKAIGDKYPLSNVSNKEMVVPTKKEDESKAPSLLGAVFGKPQKEALDKVVSFSTGSTGKGGFGSFSAASSKESSNSGSEETKKDSSGSEEAPTKEKKDEAKPEVGSFGSSSSSNLFSFGNTSAPKTTGFTFGGSASSTSSSASPSTGFSFGTSSKSTFGSVGSSSFFTGAATAASTNPPKEESKEDGPPEDEPPKVEVKTVEESDAKFSMRCKLYYKKEKDFVDRGVGMVHLKLLDDNKKVQLLVRAETNLGNILLNIMLNEQITFSQRGNNLQFVAVPNPVIKGAPDGPVSMLIKVKNATMAEELEGKISEILKEVDGSES